MLAEPCMRTLLVVIQKYANILPVGNIQIHFFVYFATKKTYKICLDNNVVVVVAFYRFLFDVYELYEFI